MKYNKEERKKKEGIEGVIDLEVQIIWQVESHTNQNQSNEVHSGNVQGGESHIPIK